MLILRRRYSLSGTGVPTAQTGKEDTSGSPFAFVYRKGTEDATMDWEITKILLTVLGGAVVLVFGQIATRFFIEPYHEYRKLVGEIADALVYYANVSSSSNPDIRERASDKYRQQASLLRVRAFVAPSCFVKYNLIPSWEAIMEASSALIGLENSYAGRDSPDVFRERTKERNTIIKNLKLPSLR
jgi:hypothetical protein